MPAPGRPEDFVAVWRGRWLAVPIGVFPVAMLLSARSEPLRLDALPFLAVGAGLGYLALSLLLDRAHFRVDDGHLTVVHRPLPWPGARVKLGSIVALHVEGRVGRNDLVGWELQAQLSDGGCVRLLGQPAAGLHYSKLANVADGLARHLGVPVR